VDSSVLYDGPVSVKTTKLP